MSRLGVTALGLFVALIAVTVGVGILAFGDMVAGALDALARLR